MGKLVTIPNRLEGEWEIYREYDYLYPLLAITVDGGGRERERERAHRRTEVKEWYAVLHIFDWLHLIIDLFGCTFIYLFCLFVAVTASILAMILSDSLAFWCKINIQFKIPFHVFRLWLILCLSVYVCVGFAEMVLNCVEMLCCFISKCHCKEWWNTIWIMY